MNQHDDMTEERAQRISEGIDTAFRFLQQAFFEDPDLVADLPSGSVVVLDRELDRAVEAAKAGREFVFWVPEQERAIRIRKVSPRWPNRDELDPGVLAVRYLRSVDTLNITLRAAPEKPLDASYGTSIRFTFDQESKLVSNIRVVRFLEDVVPRAPHLLRLLDVAELSGISHKEIEAIRAALPLRQRMRDEVGSLLAELQAIAV